MEIKGAVGKRATVFDGSERDGALQRRMTGGVSDDKSEPGRRTNRQQMQPLRTFSILTFQKYKITALYN